MRSVGPWSTRRPSHLSTLGVGSSSLDRGCAVTEGVLEASDMRVRLQRHARGAGRLRIITEPSNKRMKLTKLSPAPFRGRRCRLMPAVARLDAGTASQLIRGVGRTSPSAGDGRGAAAAGTVVSQVGVNGAGRAGASRWRPQNGSERTSEVDAGAPRVRGMGAGASPLAGRRGRIVAAMESSAVCPALHESGRDGPPNKRMKLTKLSPAPFRGRRCRLMPAPAGLDAGTASQLMRGVLRTLAGGG